MDQTTTTTINSACFLALDHRSGHIDKYNIYERQINHIEESLDICKYSGF